MKDRLEDLWGKHIRMQFGFQRKVRIYGNIGQPFRYFLKTTYLARDTTISFIHEANEMVDSFSRQGLSFLTTQFGMSFPCLSCILFHFKSSLYLL